MAKLVLPYYMRKPEMAEPINVTDISADVALVRAHNETFRIYFCMERENDPRIVDPLLRVSMPLSGYGRSLKWASMDFLLPDGLH